MSLSFTNATVNYIRAFTCSIYLLNLFIVISTDNNIPDALYSMLSDRDSQVVADTVIALEEVKISQAFLSLCCHLNIVLTSQFV